MKTASILGVHFHAVTMQQAVELAMSRIRARQKGYVVTPNPEIVDLCCRDSEYIDSAPCLLPPNTAAATALRQALRLPYGLFEAVFPLQSLLPLL